MNRNSKKLRYGFIIIAVAMLLSVIPLPYYVTMPGMAEDLRQYVNVEGAKKDEGSFLFTTVSMQRGTVWSLLKAKMTSYYEIEKREDIIPTGESDEEYSKRQKYYMKNSQDAAIINAYSYAKKPLDIKEKGAVILAVAENMPAKGVLKIGDIVVSVDGNIIQSSDELIKQVSKKKAGDTVSLSFIRDGEKKDVTLKLVQLSTKEKRAGIGVVLTTDREVKEVPNVMFNMEDIGGPSAGLMFTLEIMNQLVDVDLTKGHKIAGTGEIDENGVVGPIGGISQKVVAADREGAEIFFAPNEKGAKDSNYKEASKTAKEIGTKMKVVPVDTFEDALNYLEKLK
ncbi:MAG: SepM family pheromone-processing serine protease [Bacillaceae bacterium]